MQRYEGINLVTQNIISVSFFFSNLISFLFKQWHVNSGVNLSGYTHVTADVRSAVYIWRIFCQNFRRNKPRLFFHEIHTTFVQTLVKVSRQRERFICLLSLSKYSKQLMGLVYVKLSKLLCLLCRLSFDDFVFRQTLQGLPCQRKYVTWYVKESSRLHLVQNIRLRTSRRPYLMQ